MAADLKSLIPDKAIGGSIRGIELFIELFIALLDIGVGSNDDDICLESIFLVSSDIKLLFPIGRVDVDAPLIIFMGSFLNN